MRKRGILLTCMLSLFMCGWAMTDQEVISFIKQQSAAGKTQQQIGKALLARGVTPEQAQRIKAQYENSQQEESAVERGNQRLQGGSGERRRVQTEEIASESMENVIITNNPASARQIYGHEVFNTPSLTFEPNDNMATPQNYRLGPGDEVIIDIWGNNEDHIRQTISPEGSIMISQIGPVYLNGLTINDANKHVKSVFSQKYAGMSDEETDIQVTLGQVRSIQVDIMGEVATPGTFRLSPFSSVFHALYNAGGINDIGSIRNIQVLRNGKKIAGIDIYEYLFGGKTSGNIRLQEGDVIIVPPFDQLVNISGNVKRPMYYEIKPGETVEDLLNYAGGFTGDAYAGMVRLARQSGNENELFNVEKADFKTYKLQDGDLITVGTILDRYSNKVELKGAVYRPGMYAISPSVSTVSQLIATADGLMEDAYKGRALLYREGPELQLEVVAIDLGAILSGQVPDINLKRNDMLVISSITDLEYKGDLTIHGQVAKPGTYPFAENITLEDLIIEAGGLLQGASTARVDIARRIIDPSSLQPTQQLAQLYSVNIEKGLAVGYEKGFELMPYDVVTVRTSPGYEKQEFVRINGEVLFGGQYALEKRNERLTDIIRRAGGILDEAYIKGAHLERQLSEDEYLARTEALKFAMANSGPNQGDSIALSKIEVSRNYNVGIDLQKAIDYPGSSYDLILQPGDYLYIPQQQSTVKISGDVMFPNTVVYEPGKKLKHYINQAGGYGQRAKKGKAFIVYMNGTVSKANGNTPIEPGCQIIVPTKPRSGGTDWTKVLAFATSFSSVATMAATVYNIFK